MDKHLHQVWVAAFHATLLRSNWSTVSDAATKADEAVEVYKKSVEKLKA
jgi:hypothetical protein